MSMKVRLGWFCRPKKYAPVNREVFFGSSLLWNLFTFFPRFTVTKSEGRTLSPADDNDAIALNVGHIGRSERYLWHFAPFASIQADMNGTDRIGAFGRLVPPAPMPEFRCRRPARKIYHFRNLLRKYTEFGVFHACRLVYLYSTAIRQSMHCRPFAKEGNVSNSTPTWQRPPHTS